MRIASSSLLSLRLLAAIGAVIVIGGTLPTNALAYINGIDVYSGDGTIN